MLHGVDFFSQKFAYN